MTKSMKKVLSGLLIGLMTLTLTTFIQAQANPVPAGIGTPSDPAQASITKYLEMPIGTITPDTTFVFDFTPLSFNETAVANLPAGTTVPAIPIAANATAANAVFTPAMTATNLAPGRADVDRVIVTTGDVVDGVAWARPGVYVYRVTERTNTFTNTSTERMYFDNTIFHLYVIVSEDASGNLYVSGTWGWRINVVDGEDVKVVPKLDPDPNNPGEGGQTGESDLVYTNVFIRRSDDITTTPPPTLPNEPGPGPNVPGPGGTPDPGVPSDLDSALIVSKKVTGAFASINDTFTFSGSIENSSLVVAAPGTTYDSFVAFVYQINAAGDYVRTATSHTFVPGTPVTFTLRHGQALVFDRIPIGNIFVATETDSGVYRPRIDLVTNGVTRGNHALSTSGTVGTNNVPPLPHRIGEASNIAAFTNTHGQPPITGLVLDNLPLVFVAVATLAVVTIVVVNKKRRAYE
jgi:hypothetical protein